MTPENILISKKEIREKIKTLEKNADRKVCLIFGAGASYGYTNNPDYIAPVVAKLFDEKIPVVAETLKKHPLIKINTKYYTKQISHYNNDLEKYLSDRYTNQRDDKLFSSLLSYLEDIFFLVSKNINVEDNNYKELLSFMWDIHGKKEWSCISFNYDTILEQSYLAMGRDTATRNFDNLDDYNKMKPAIIKMHGGINFRYIFTKKHSGYDEKEYNSHKLFSMMMDDNRPAESFLRVENIDGSKPQKYSVDNFKDSSSQTFFGSQFNSPLMLIPIHEAISPENSFFKKNLEIAKVEVEKASIIIAIGYNFGDQAFISELEKIDFSKKEIILIDTLKSINNKENYAAFQNLKKIKNINIKMFVGDGFKEFVDVI